MAGATPQKTPKSETSINRELINEDCANVSAFAKRHNRIDTVAAHVTMPAIHNHFRERCKFVIRIALSPPSPCLSSSSHGQHPQIVGKH